MIAILLASCNGERYISAQLDSLLAQTERDFVVRIHDDRSTDGTRDVLERYAASYPDRIFPRFNREKSGGAKWNFFEMMRSYRADYVMLCDQDDVWLPDKIERTLLRMRELEAQHGAETPALVHTDLVIADEELNAIRPSYREAMRADYSKTSLRNVLVQNTVTGCTAMYNRALAELLTEPPSYAVMHDWWVELLAAAFGVIGCIDEAPILYRQHGANSVGAGDMRSPGYILGRIADGGGIRGALRNTCLQARSLLELHSERMTPEQRQLVEAYASIPERSKPGRILTSLRLGTMKNGLIRKVAQMIYI